MRASLRGKRTSAVLAVAALIVLIVSAGCTSRFDRKKFDAVNTAALAVKKAFDGGATYKQVGQLIEAFSREITVLRGGGAMSGREKDLLADYSFLLSIYRDGYLLWRCQRESEKYGFIPKGLIYVWQDVDPLVEKYGIPTESHLYGPTQAPWRSIPGDSLNKVWASADTQLKVIEGLLND